MPGTLETRVSILFAAVTLAIAGGGCQLFVDLDGLEDMHCGPNEKSCAGGCVPKNNPNTGCALLQCAPCAPPNAKADCGNNGECILAGCVGDWKDCNQIYKDGCETDLAHDPYNCGACDFQCAKPKDGIAGCSNKMCTIGGCTPPHEDCDGDYMDGCEATIGTDAQCMYCGVPCAEGTHCSAGICM